MTLKAKPIKNDIVVSISKQNIKNLFDEAQEIVARGEKPNFFALQKKYGYSESSAKAYRVLKTKTWQRLLETIDDEKILNRFNDIIENGTESGAIRAGVEMLKLKNRYPKKSLADNFAMSIKDLLE